MSDSDGTLVLTGWFDADLIDPASYGPVGQVNLATVSTPATRTNHYLYVKARAKTNGNVAIQMALMEGATNLSGTLQTGSLTTSFATFIVAVSNTAAAAINAYNDLSVQFWGYSPTGDTVSVQISQLYLKVPNPSAPYLTPTPGAITNATALVSAATGFSPTAQATATATALVSAPTGFSPTAQATATASETIAAPTGFSATAQAQAQATELITALMAVSASATATAQAIGFLGIPQNLSPNSQASTSTQAVFVNWQIMRPSGDLVTTGWTPSSGVTLYPMINDVSDSTYIYSTV